MEFLFDYGLFLAKIATVVVSIIAILVAAKAVGGKSTGAKGELEVTNLTEQYKDTVVELEHHLFDDAELKARAKAEKKAEKETEKAKHGLFSLFLNNYIFFWLIKPTHRSSLFIINV